VPIERVVVFVEIWILGHAKIAKIRFDLWIGSGVHGID